MIYRDWDNVDTEVLEYDSKFVSNNKIIKCFEDAFEFIEFMRNNFEKYSFDTFEISEKYNIDIVFLRNLIIEALNFSKRFINTTLIIKKKLCNKSVLLELSDTETKLCLKNFSYYITININEDPYYILYKLCTDLYISNSNITIENIDELIINKLKDNDFTLGEECCKNFKLFTTKEVSDFLNRRAFRYVEEFFTHLDNKTNIKKIKSYFKDSHLYKAFLDNLYVAQFIKDMGKTDFMKGFEKEYNIKDCHYIGKDKHEFTSYKRIRKHVVISMNTAFKCFLVNLFKTYNKNYIYDFITKDFNFKLIDYDSFLDRHENYLYVRHYEYAGKYQRKQNIQPGLANIWNHWGIPFIEQYRILQEHGPEYLDNYLKQKELDEFVNEIL